MSLLPHTQSQTKFFADPMSFLQSSSTPVSLFHPPPLTLHVTDYVYSAPIALSRSSPARDLRIPPCRAFRSASGPTLRSNSSILNKCTKANMDTNIAQRGGWPFACFFSYARLFVQSLPPLLHLINCLLPTIFCSYVYLFCTISSRHDVIRHHGSSCISPMCFH
jgi:hypothetical protein